MMPLLFVLTLKNFQYSFINNFLIITKTSRVPYCQQSALLSAEFLQYSFINNLPSSTKIKLKNALNLLIPLFLV